MSVPLWVESFAEPECDRHWRPGLVDRILAMTAVKVAIAIAVGVVLWIDLARQGPWAGLPGPSDVLGGYVGYMLATVAGVLIAAISRSVRQSSDTARVAHPNTEPPRLPVFLRFDHRRVVVVGGGPVAASKIPALLAAGGEVTVIAPHVSDAIDRSTVRVIEREFVPADLDAAWFVTAAATADVNRDVRMAAEQRGIFVNAVDDPENATAYLGGTIARGGVTVAFSTSGQAPALAGLLREAFDELVPADIGTWVERASELRKRQRRDGVAMPQRRPELLEALNRLYDRP